MNKDLEELKSTLINLRKDLEVIESLENIDAIKMSLRMVMSLLDKETKKWI